MNDRTNHDSEVNILDLGMDPQGTGEQEFAAPRLRLQTEAELGDLALERLLDEGFGPDA